MMAALLLVVAHAGFKGALFLGAGSIERSTGTRDLDQLGGLIHRMPFTAALFALSACSIMAVPTLSGFSSEWLLLQGLLHGFTDRSTPTLIMMLVGVVALALTGGLTAVAFVKAFGIGFLGQARSPGAANAVDVAPSMKIAMALLVIPSIVIGVVPGLLLPLINRAATTGLARDQLGPDPVSRHHRTGRAVRRTGAGALDRLGRQPTARPAQRATRRCVELWTRRADASHAVHRDFIRRAPPKGLRRRVAPPVRR
jgi:formate hydrogenlyase subunit 3/multisubunit Na+/H+ antiporter MnhD subunit